MLLCIKIQSLLVTDIIIISLTSIFSFFVIQKFTFKKSNFIGKPSLNSLDKDVIMYGAFDEYTAIHIFFYY